MSQKKHQPGCPCCGGESGNVCCVDEVEPDIVVSGYTQTSFSSGGQCCKQVVFQPDSSDPVFECCEQVSQHEIEAKCETDYYQFERVNFNIIGPPPSCPFPQSICCLDPPPLIATFLATHLIRQTNFFTAQVWLDTVRVIWGKEEISCPTTDPPECRYFVKVVLNFRYATGVNSSVYSRQTLANTYLHPCFLWTGSPYDIESTTCTTEEACEATREFADDCRSTQNPGSPLECFEDGGTFCVQRIKFFTTRPTGIITFNDTDVLGTCEEPVCNDLCSGYEQEVCFASPSTFNPPHWCTNPPTVTSETTTFVADQSQCEGVLWYEPFSCDSFVASCFPTTPCNSPVSVDTVCEGIEWPEYEEDFETCRFATPLPNNLGPYCSCFEPTELFGVVFDVVGKTTNTNCDDLPSCYTRLECDGVLVSCQWNFIGIGTASNDVTVTINCGAYTQAECCFTPGPFSIELSYSE